MGSSTTDTPLRVGRILVAEGHPVIGGALSWLLREHGYSVATVADCDELKTSVARETPDVIVLDADVALGERDLLQQLRADQRYHDVRIIVASSFTSIDGTTPMLPWGADDSVSKPFRVPELLGRVRTQVRASSQLRAARALLRETTAELARATSVPVIASGGLAGIDDVKALLRPEYAMLEGAITGRALYDGRLDAREALALLSGPRAGS